MEEWKSKNYFLNNGKECIILNNCLEILLLKEYYRKNIENRKKNSEFEKWGYVWVMFFEILIR